MGEPSFNPAVLEVLQEFSNHYEAPGFYPSLSTIAPKGAEDFLEHLLIIKDKYYQERFQFQFSIHSTNVKQRNWLIPVKTWDFDKMAKFGEKFHRGSNQKTTLNFALADNSIIERDVLLKHFNPDKFIIKITPVNPTYIATENNFRSTKTKSSEYYGLVNSLNNVGYEVIVSIGDLTENEIGSNCGQHVMNFLKNKVQYADSYTFPLQNFFE
jgi:23S rRNA (adenine2503-C2)-methyltransferase